MTLVGCCYDGSTNRLRLELALPFLAAYCSYLPLLQAERAVFVPFLRWSLLAIGYWRWQNFNVVHDDNNARKDAYKQMQQRVEELDDRNITDALEKALDQATAATFLG